MASKSIRALKVALEIRHASWFVSPLLDLLTRYNAALVSSDWHQFATPLVRTADFAYIRRHGPTTVYSSLYDEDAIRADIASLLMQECDEAYVLFNNDIHGYAPKNAMQMRDFLSAGAR
jgi:uncharacterized protein YecE (DUF72 family)